MDGWIDEWIDKWMDGWMDGWMYEQIHVHGEMDDSMIWWING